jgi:hydrogenase nickel incorporation protein HypA/HybF
MHELAVTQQILDIALAKARENGASEIQLIQLVIGDMTSIIDDSVQFYFDILSKNTIASKARLDIQRVPVELRCRNCRTAFTPSVHPWQCPRCQSWNFEIISGNEFYVASLDLND